MGSCIDLCTNSWFTSINGMQTANYKIDWTQIEVQDTRMLSDMLEWDTAHLKQFNET